MREFFTHDGGICFRTNEWLPGRKTLFFIHGLSGSCSAWKPFESRLGDRFNLCALDLRGHGKSLRPRDYESYEMGRFAEDVRQVVTELGATDPVFVSHSFGTLVTLEYLKAHQSEVEAVVLLSPSAAPRRGFGPRLLRPILALGRLFHLYRPSKKRGDHVDYAIHPQRSDWDVSALLLDIENSSWGVYFYVMEQALRVDYTAILPSLTLPALLIRGGRDTVFPTSHDDAFRRAMPQATLETIERGDHVIVKNNVEEIVASIEAFLEGM